MLVVLTLIALGTIVGGWLARRFPLDRVRTICALIAIFASFLVIARAAPNSWQAWLAMVLAVVLLSDVLISGIRRLQAPRVT